MKSDRLLRMLCASLLAAAAFANAEDIDIFSGNSNSGVPNILLVMDTGANFSGAANPGCASYSAAAGGGASSTNANNWSENWADEWARYMFQKDASANFGDEAGPGGSVIRPSDLYDATDCSAATVVPPCTARIDPKVPYSGQDPGYYITLNAGEKGVNAPLVVAGSVYFGTNLPKPVNPLLCTSNLGEARGYRLFPFTGAYGYAVFASEGLPPSPIAGVVQVEKRALLADGSYVNKIVKMPFGIGLGGGHRTPRGDWLVPQPPGSSACNGPDCTSALGGGKPPIQISSSRTRTYWYIQNH